MHFNSGAAAALAILAATLMTTTAFGQQPCTCFDNKADFEAFNLGHGKFLKGVEDFEESNIEPGGKRPLPAPLVGNEPNVGPDGVGFPNGLLQKNIEIWDNTDPNPNPPGMNPSGLPTALYVIGPGFLGSNSVKVGEDLFLDGIHASLDLLFTEPNHTGVGFLLSRFEGFFSGGWHITVYDKNNVEMGKCDVLEPAGPEPGKTFIGVWCESSIGRINVWDGATDPAGLPVPSADAVDEIQMWQEEPIAVEPATWGLIKATFQTD